MQYDATTRMGAPNFLQGDTEPFANVRSDWRQNKVIVKVNISLDTTSLKEQRIKASKNLRFFLFDFFKNLRKNGDNFNLKEIYQGLKPEKKHRNNVLDHIYKFLAPETFLQHVPESHKGHLWDSLVAFQTFFYEAEYLALKQMEAKRARQHAGRFIEGQSIVEWEESTPIVKHAYPSLLSAAFVKNCQDECKSLHNAILMFQSYVIKLVYLMQNENFHHEYSKKYDYGLISPEYFNRRYFQKELVPFSRPYKGLARKKIPEYYFYIAFRTFKLEGSFCSVQTESVLDRLESEIQDTTRKLTALVTGRGFIPGAMARFMTENLSKESVNALFGSMFKFFSLQNQFLFDQSAAFERTPRLFLRAPLVYQRFLADFFNHIRMQAHVTLKKLKFHDSSSDAAQANAQHHAPASLHEGNNNLVSTTVLKAALPKFQDNLTKAIQQSLLFFQELQELLIRFHVCKLAQSSSSLVQSPPLDLSVRGTKRPHESESGSLAVKIPRKIT